MNAGIWSIIIPARLTWLLQPLDVYVFHSLKWAIRDALHNVLLVLPGNTASNLQMLRITIHCVERVLLRNAWPLAFARCGFGSHQRLISRSICRALQINQFPTIPNSVPTLQQLRCIWPVGRPLPVTVLYAPFSPAPQPRRTASIPSLPTHSLPVGRPIWHIDTTEGITTRSRTRDALGAVFARATSSSAALIPPS